MSSPVCTAAITTLMQMRLFPIQCRMNIKDVSAATMFDVLHDSQYRKSWDPTMLESFDIARLAPNADVGYYSCESCNLLNLCPFLRPLSCLMAILVILWGFC